MLDAALALTPSASMLNSSLAHQHRQKSWGVGWGGGVVRGCHFPRISKQSSGKRGGEKKSLWFTRFHSSDLKWSLRWSQTKRTHRLHGGARLKLRIPLAPVIQTFTRKVQKTALCRNLDAWFASQQATKDNFLQIRGQKRWSDPFLLWANWQKKSLICSEMLQS